MRVYKIKPGRLAPCYTTEITDISWWISDAESWTRITVDILEMTPEEFNELPEYVGP